MTQPLIFRDLGNCDYQTAWDYQEKLLQENISAKSSLRQRQSTIDDSNGDDEPSTQHYLLFVEHPPVYTLGKSGKEENLLIAEEDRINKDIQYFKINRGGDITYHGPGQLVGYPILDLEKLYTDIGKYLRNLEEVIIKTLAGYGLEGKRSKGETGVWLDPDIPGKERKICAMGVRCSRWITMHGFALNVNTDLSYFNHIIPCGIVNKQVTSIEKELGSKVDLDEVKEKLKQAFEEVFEMKIHPLSP